MNLSSKVAPVTGSARSISTSSIGLGIARPLATNGANVLLNGCGDKALVDTGRRADPRNFSAG